MAKVEKGRSGKPSERKPAKKETAPQQLDQGSEESKFQPRLREMYQRPGRAGSDEGVRLQECHAGAEARAHRASTSAWAKPFKT